jgi:hypothetical protein
MTAENEQLLSITARHPDARVETTERKDRDYAEKPRR